MAFIKLNSNGSTFVREESNTPLMYSKYYMEAGYKTVSGTPKGRRAILRFVPFTTLPLGEKVIQANIYIYPQALLNNYTWLKLYKKNSGQFNLGVGTMTYSNMTTWLNDPHVCTLIQNPVDTAYADNKFTRKINDYNSFNTTNSSGVPQYNKDFILVEKTPNSSMSFYTYNYSHSNRRPYIVIQYTQAPTWVAGNSAKQEAYNRVAISWVRIENLAGNDYGGIVGDPEDNLVRYEVYRALGDPNNPTTPPADTEYQYIFQTNDAKDNWLYDYGAQWETSTWKNRGFTSTNYWYKVKAVWQIGSTEYKSGYSTNPPWLDPQSQQRFYNDPAPGVNVTLTMINTHGIYVNDTVTVSSSAGSETANVVTVTNNQSIVVDNLGIDHTTTNSYVTRAAKYRLFVNVIDMSPQVQRFLLRDLEGYFPDYVFEINPTDYNPVKTESMFQEKIALSGRRGVIKFDRQPESREMSWERIHRTMFNQLRNRYLSGHTFYLYDHNDEEIVGVIDEFDFDEIVATVPSAYKGGFTIKGIGKPEDTSYGS